MGWADRISEVFAAERMVPSPGQGALAIQATRGSEAAELMRALDDPAVSGAVEIERAFLREVGAGCTYPVGALASATAGGWRFIAMLADASGERVAFADDMLLPGDENCQVAETAARMMLDVGMELVSRSWLGWDSGREELSGFRVVVTRPRRQAGTLLDALEERGAKPISLPTIRVEPMADTSELDGAIFEARSGLIDWLVFSSVNAVDVTASRLAALGLSPGQLGVRVAAVGDATARAARDAGFTVAITPQRATANDLVLALRGLVRPGERVLYPRSAIGRNVLPEGLRQLGAVVIVVNAYQTVPEHEIDSRVLEQVKCGEFDGIVFFSPSSVRRFIELAGDRAPDACRGGPAFCVGPVTAQAAEESGFKVAAISDDPGVTAIVNAIATYRREQDRARRETVARGPLVVAGRSEA
jgi:uroporphyrinogen-III synthase